MQPVYVMATLIASNNATQPIDRALLIAAQRISTHYRSMPSAFIGIALVATILVVIMPPLKNPLVAPIWVSCVYASSTARFILWRSYRRTNPPPQDVKRWGVYAIIVYGLSGILWGIGNIVLYVPGNLNFQIVLLFSSWGAAMGALVGQVSYIPTFYAYMYPLLILSTLAFLREPDPTHIAFCVLMFVNLVVGTRLAQNLHRSYMESVNLRFENLELIEDLKVQKDVIEHALKTTEDANVAKSQFLAAASHDLRQPLHAMSLFVQALEESELPVAERATLGKVRRSVDVMEELFNALLDVSKLDAGVVPVSLSTVPLQPILERVIAQCQPQAQGKSLSLRLRCAPVYVRTDPILLERILRNLVTNAVCHTLQGGALLAWRRRGDAVSLEVWDTGPGIPSYQQQMIFREFTQLANPERDRRKGLGLGLAIVERLSNLLHHPLMLRSRIGRGSMFALAVPRGEAHDYIPPSTVRLDVGAFNFSDKFVLVIDNEIAVQEGMCTLLEKWGCKVISAGSSAEILAHVSEVTRPPDLIISDFRLGNGENGIDVIELLRNEFNIDVPAFLITGDTSPEWLRLAEKNGLPILHKPLSLARLRTLMAGVLLDKSIGDAT